jgi:hypothetical protein
VLQASMSIFLSLCRLVDLEFDRGDRYLDDRRTKIVVSIWHGSTGSDVLLPLLKEKN